MVPAAATSSLDFSAPWPPHLGATRPAPAASNPHSHLRRRSALGTAPKRITESFGPGEVVGRRCNDGTGIGGMRRGAARADPDGPRPAGPAARPGGPAAGAGG